MKANNLYLGLFCSLLLHTSIFIIPFSRFVREKTPITAGMISVDFIHRARNDAKPGQRTTSRNILYEKPSGSPAAESRARQKVSSNLDDELPTGEYDLTGPEGPGNTAKLDSLPAITKYVEPYYPESAIERKIEGVVTLKILIDATGVVKQLKVVDNGGFYQFGIEAYRAVKKWKFSPARVRNSPVSVWCTQKVKFVLENAGQ